MCRGAAPPLETLAPAGSHGHHPPSAASGFPGPSPLLLQYAGASVAELIVKTGKHRGRSVKLAAGETLIGREKGCPIRLATADVSRRHCRLVVAGVGPAEAVTVEDLGSRNGTFVNDHPAAGVTVLKPGDRLRVGPVRFALSDPNEASESEVVNWLVPPPAAGTVTPDAPTDTAGGFAEGDTAVGATSPADEEPVAAPPVPDEAVLLAARVIRERRAA